MKKGKCPKCGSQEIYSGAGISLKGGTYGCNTIPLGGVFGRHAPLDNYVCAECGYVESYINSAGDLEKIRSRWPHIYYGKRTGKS